MADKLIQDATLKKLADAIRIKTDSTGTVTPAQMGKAVLKAGFGQIPAWHYAEAMDVISKIQEVRRESENVLVFGVIADSHVNVGSDFEVLSKTSIRHGAFALETVGLLTPCDFVANLGDNCWGNNIDTEEDYAAAEYLNDCISAAFGGMTGYRLVGNHDQSASVKKIYALNGAHNVFDVSAATVQRGYGYTDCADKKVRVIVLNTSDYWNTTGGYDMSYEQKDFLMRALDLSQKEDPSQWQILILSHFPLDHPDVSTYDTQGDVKAILDAYVDGSGVSIPVNSTWAAAEREDPTAYETYSDGALSYQYSGKNAAKIIGNFHGHVHNVSFGEMADNGVIRVSAPNTCFYLEKGSVDDLYIVDAAYAKLEGTEQDTAVTFYAVDLDSRIIHAFAYGAGADRVISYAGAKTYPVTYTLTGCTSSNTLRSAVEGKAYTTTLTPNDSDAVWSGVSVYMGGTDITDQCYSDGTVSIEAVTGDIVINAVALVTEWSETVADLAVAIRQNWHFGSSATVPELNSDNAYAALAVTTENDFGFTDREGNAVYLMPVDQKASRITVTIADGSDCTYRYHGLKTSGAGKLAVVFDSKEGAAATYTWTKGTIDYILATACHTDGTSWDWEYDDAQVSVTFSNT